MCERASRARQRYRVVQWATGNIGLRALREVIRHPGARARGRAGVRPRRRTASTRASCAARDRSVSPRPPIAPRSARSGPTACSTCRACSTSTTSSRCSKPGTNVVTTRGELFAGGHRLGDDGRARVARRVRARRRRRSTRREAAPGSSPTRSRSRCCRCSAASSRSRSRSSRTCRGATRRTCCSSRWGSASRSTRSTRSGPRYLLGEFAAAARGARRGRGPAGRRVDVRRRGRGRARSTTQSGAGELAAGSVAAQRTTIVGDEQRRRGRAVHRQLVLHDRSRAGVGPAADRMARARARRRAVRRRDRLSRPARGPRGRSRRRYTANRPVNAIPYVCAAAPGILSTTDLPPITPGGTGGSGRRSGR